MSKKWLILINVVSLVMVSSVFAEEEVQEAVSLEVVEQAPDIIEESGDLAYRAEPFAIRKKHQGKHCDNRDKSAEQYFQRDPKKPDANRFVERKITRNWGLMVPKAHSCPLNEGFVFGIDYLIMRAYNQDLVYAYQKTDNVIPGSLDNIVVEGQMVRPNMTWRPGVRVGLGWNTPYDFWDVNLGWTYYFNKSVTNRAQPDIDIYNSGEEGFWPYWAVPRSTTASSTARSREFFQNMQGTWKLNYNTLNLELGRSLYFTKAVALRTHFGLQTGWIHQSMGVSYERTANAYQANNGELVNGKSDFWGFGLRTGLEGEWMLGYGFSILGKSAISALSGRTQARRLQSSRRPGLDYLRSFSIRDRNSQIAPSCEGLIGLSWGSCLGCDNMFLSFSANWEFMYWFSQMNFLRPAGLENNTTVQDASEEYPFSSGLLKIEGVSIKGQFDF